MNKNKYLYKFGTRRRLLIAGASWPVLAWAGVARAQSKSPVVIGWLYPGSRGSASYLLKAFNAGMSALGWTLGTQYVIEERWLDGRMESLQAMAEDLAATKPHVIVAASATPAKAAAKAAPYTPIVMAGGTPLESGLVKSLARPGGMVTGVAGLEVDLIGKHVELVLEAAPKMRRIGFLIDPVVPSIAATREAIQKAAKHYSIDARLGEASKLDELEPALTRIVKEGAHATVITPAPWFSASAARQRIMQFANANRVCVLATSFEFAEEGALIAYGRDRSEAYRRVAYFVDRILKGAKPADLPMEQPTKFEMVLNLKAAKALGITFPKTILVSATKVIE